MKVVLWAHLDPKKPRVDYINEYRARNMQIAVARAEDLYGNHARNWCKKGW